MKTGDDGRVSADDVLEELERVRALGLPRLGEAKTENLRRIASGRMATGNVSGDPVGDRQIEELLAASVDRLRGERARRAAKLSFGLTDETRESTAFQRRERAADVHGIGWEQFRKKYEKPMLRQVALSLAELHLLQGEFVPGPVGAARSAGARNSSSLPVSPGPATEFAPQPVRAGQHPVQVVFPHGVVELTLHVTPIEHLDGIDVLVSSENVYFEMSKTFRSTVSGSVRRAGAVKDAGGRIFDDVIARELRLWVEKSVPAGPPVAAGTVAVTAPGQLADRGVRLLLHAAVAEPTPGHSGYVTAHGAVAEAVRRVFEVAAYERRVRRLPLRSLALPLLGAGHGGLDARTSAEAVLGALEGALAADPDWQVHLVTRNQVSARAVLDALAARAG